MTHFVGGCDKGGKESNKCLREMNLNFRMSCQKKERRKLQRHLCLGSELGSPEHFWSRISPWKSHKSQTAQEIFHFRTLPAVWLTLWNSKNYKSDKTSHLRCLSQLFPRNFPSNPPERKKFNAHETFARLFPSWKEFDEEKIKITNTQNSEARKYEKKNFSSARKAAPRAVC